MLQMFPSLLCICSGWGHMKHALHDSGPSGFNVGVRISLDPIDLSPFGHLMKFTQRSFPLY